MAALAPLPQPTPLFDDDADDLYTALAAVEVPFDVKLVRGTDERTVQVGGGTTATGEA